MNYRSILENEIAIQARIQQAFEATGEETRISCDIAFHMTDWLSDVIALFEIYSNIETRSDDEIRAFVYGFLAHVPNHVNAAAKLSGIGKVEDVFKIGIFEDDE